MKYCYDYPRPAVTVDAALLAKNAGKWHVLLIERKHDPFSGCWALPGGFVDENESVEEAMMRELMEETSLQVENLRQFRVYSKPGRDPRGHTVTVVFLAELAEIPAGAKAGDDAGDLRWFPLSALPKLAFDHAEILNDISDFRNK